MRPQRIFLLAMLAACLHPAEARTAADEDVGVAFAQGTRITIDDGLAAVRTLDHGEIHLWAQAPTLEIHAETAADGPEEWTLAIDNCLADAELISADAVAIAPLAADWPTERRWSVRIPPGRPITLHLRVLDADRADGFRFALLSDIQEAIDGVKDIFALMNADPLIRFVVSTGDLTDHGTREELSRFQTELRALRVPFYSTVGNHDISDSETAFRETFGRGNFRFVFRGVQLTFLDSASATIEPRAYEWLDQWLAEGQNRAHVVIMHIPPFDPVGARNAAFGSRAEAAKVVTRLAEGRVDLALYGHVHSFYAFANAGIPAYISGGGGAHPETMDGIGRHYLTVDVDARRVVSTALVRVDRP